MIPGTARIPLRVLIVEDSEFDARVLVNTLKQGGYEPEFKRVQTADATREALATGKWDFVLSDYNMPGFNALGALKVLQESKLDLPFIIISGGIGEDIAVAAMKAGAHDYLMKGNLARLVPAVERELRDAATRHARHHAEHSLRESELRYRLLWETASDAVILMDTQSRIEFANPAVERVFGYKPEELIGESLTLLQPPAARAQHRAGLQRYIESGQRNLNWKAIEMTAMRKDGTELAVELSLGEMELHGRRWFVGFIRDVTERKRAEAELRANQEQFRVAREIQQRLFPKDSPALPGFDIAGASFPADATGGDYFDFIPMLHDRTGIVVADVTGHGIGPALLMAETRAYLRIVARNREDVGEILTRANLVLAEDVDYERFVTLFFARIDPVKRDLVYASAGHPSAFLLDARGDVKLELPRTGIPLGLRPDNIYKASESVQFEPGDILLLVTDGIEESMTAKGEFFGIERALEVVRGNAQKPAGEIVRAIYQAVLGFCGDAPQLDDVTCIVVKVL